MPLMYDWQLGHSVYVPDDQVDQSVASGQRTFRKGVEIPVIGPDGEYTTIASEDAQRAFTPEYGYRWFGTREQGERARADIAKVYEDAYSGPAMAAQAGLVGAARSLTFGLSDVAARGLGGENLAQGLQMLREQQPGASLAGEIGGIIGGTLLTGGLGGVAGAGVRGATRAGMAVERGVAGLLQPTSRLGDIAAKAAAAGAGSAAEGLFYGAGQLVSEAALGDPALNTQHAITTLGLSGLLGGALGGVTKGGIEAFKAGKSALNNLAQRVAQKEAVIEQVADKTSKEATEAVQKAFEGYAKVLKNVRGLDDEAAETVARIFDRSNEEGRLQIMKALENPRYVAENGASAIKELVEEATKRADDVMANRNAIQERMMVEKVTGQETKAARAVLEQVDAAIQEMGKARYQGGGKLMQDLRDELFESLFNANNTLKAGIKKGDVHAAMHKFRQNIDEIATPFEVQRIKPTTKKFREIREAVRGHLRDDTIYGADIKRWAKADDLYTELKDATKAMTAKFGQKTFTTDANALRLLRARGEALPRKLDEEKVRRWLLNPESMKSMQTTRELERFQEAARQLQLEVDNIAGAAGMVPAPQRSLASIDDAIGKLQQARASITMLNALESQTGKSLHGLLLGGFAGQELLGDVPGAGLIGAGIGAAFANPRAAVRYLASFERRRASGQNLVRAAVGSFLHKSIDTAKSVAKATGKPIVWDKAVEQALRNPPAKYTLSRTADMLGDEQQPDDKRKPIRRLRDAIEENKNPETIDNRLMQNNPFIDESAPENYAQATGVVARSVRFLESKLPRGAHPGAMLPGEDRISKSEEQKLERYIQAIAEPRVILQQLATGKINRETVEAIRAVYPQMFYEIQQQVLEYTSQNPEGLDYNRKLQLGILFGVPSIPALADLAQNQSAMGEFQLEQAETQQRQKRALADTAATQSRTSMNRALNR